MTPKRSSKNRSLNGLPPEAARGTRIPPAVSDTPFVASIDGAVPVVIGAGITPLCGTSASVYRPGAACNRCPAAGTVHRSGHRSCLLVLTAAYHLYQSAARCLWLDAAALGGNVPGTVSR